MTEDNLPKLDLKAGRQRFTYDKKVFTAHVPPDTENPIDIRLRQLALLPQQDIDLRGEFYHKNIAAMVGDINNLCIMKGRIVDIYFVTRDIRFKTRKGVDVIVSFDKVMAVSEREI